MARAAFSGSGELEDGGLELEDIICVLSSLIDHVRPDYTLHSFDACNPHGVTQSHLLTPSQSFLVTSHTHRGRSSSAQLQTDSAASRQLKTSRHVVLKQLHKSGGVRQVETQYTACKMKEWSFTLCP